MRETPRFVVFRRALKASMPVMAGYLVLGMGFGILLCLQGYSPVWALAMSVFIYAGSMQYLTIPLLVSGASLISAALTTLLVNARHLFYGISMVNEYQKLGKYEPYSIFALTDETYSLVCRKDKENNPEERKRYIFLVSLLNQCYWVAGSMVGAFLAGVLPFDAKGIDFSLTALFVTVFLEQWVSARDHAPALIGLGASLLCLLIFGAHNFLIPTMALILLLIGILQPGRKKEDNA